MNVHFLHCSAEFYRKMSVAKIPCFHNGMLQLKLVGGQCSARPLQASECQEDERSLLGTGGVSDE